MAGMNKHPMNPPASWSGCNLRTGLLILALAANATTVFSQAIYYVDPAGNDTNTGLSTNEPFRTVQRALNVVAPGDTITLRGGTYREHLTSRTHGTESAPISMLAYPGEIPVIKGSREVTNWSLYTGNIWRVTGWTNRSQQVLFNGQPLQQIGQPINPFIVANGLLLEDLVQGSFFHDATNSLLYVWLPDNQSPVGQLIEASVGDDLFVFTIGRYYLLDGIDFQHSNVLGQWPGIYLDESSLMVNCSITYMNYIGILMRSHTRIENCLVAHNGAAGINADFASSNVVIIANQVISNNYRGANASMMAAGIRTYASSSFAIVSNYVAHNLANGIWSDFCRDDSPKLIHGNTIVHTRAHPARPDNVPVALFVEISQHVLVANNLLFDNEVIGISIAESDHIDAFNNTVVRTRGLAALHGRNLSRWIPATHFETNNTVWASLTNNRMFNNLLHDNQADYDLYWHIPSTNETMIIASNRIDHNLYYRPAQHARFFVDQLFTNFITFTTTTGLDTNSFHQDPRLASPEADNFRLSAFSVAVDAGTDDLPIALPPDDRDGASRILFDHPDLGCFEFNGSAEAIAPMVTITTSCGWVAYDAYGVAGINNANVVGTILAEVIDTSVGTTNQHTVSRSGESTWRLEAFEPVPLTTYEITIRGTNWNGTESSASCTIQRGDLGTGQPWVTITNTPETDLLAGDYLLAGTRNVHVTGFHPWHNIHAGQVVATGTVVATSGGWEALISGMQTGHNYIVITGTNDWGVTHSVTTRIHFGETFTHYVATNAPTPLYPYTSWDTAARTIMDALDAASDGDLVLVGPGIYQSGGQDHTYGYSRVLLDKAVTLESSDGPAATVIRGYRSGGPITVRGVLMLNTGAVLRGFTIRDAIIQGYPVERTYGAGLLAIGGGLVEQCSFADNNALPEGVGGGAALQYYSGTLRDCSFTGNEAYFGGGLAVLWGDDATVHTVKATGNYAAHSGGGFLVDNSSRFSSAVAWSNQADVMGGGIALANNTSVRNVTIEQNTAPAGGGIALIGNQAAIYSSSAYSNSPPDIAAISNHLSHIVHYSVLSTNPPAHWSTIGNLVEDPVYADPQNQDFRLTTNSPGLNRGIYSVLLLNLPDADGHHRLVGGQIDIGAYEFWHTLWIYPSMTGYVAGATNRIDVRYLWANDRALTVSNVTLRLPEGWSLDHAESSGAVLPIVGNSILVDQTYTNRETNLIAWIAVAPGQANVQTVQVAIAGALTKSNDMIAVSSDSQPLSVHPYQWLDITASGSGSVTATLALGWTPYNQIVTASAQANPGWRLRGWLGDTSMAITNENGDLTFTMDQNRVLQADFVELVTLTIFSDFDVVEPAATFHVIDRGTRVEFIARNAVTNGGQTYVIADWIGTGSLPTGGTQRAFSLVIDEHSTLTWRWCEVQAQQTSRGYRNQGAQRGSVAVAITFDVGANVQQVWYRPGLGPGATLLGASGPYPVSVSNGCLVVQDNLANGQVNLEFDVAWPDDTTGPVLVTGDTGVNALPDGDTVFW